MMAIGFYVLLLSFCSTVVCQSPPSRDHTMEAKLIQDKFLNNSDSATWVFVRPPSTDVGDAVKVNLGINYFRLKHIDEKSGQLTASFFETRSWLDARLQWNPEDYNGISKISLPPSYIWTPDFQYMHDRGGVIEFDNHPVYGAKAVIHNTGMVIHVPEVETSFACQFDLTWFPFDTQYCDLELLSWIHHKEELEALVSTDMGDSSRILHHADWTVKEVNMTSTSKTYDCCPETYQTIKIHTKIERIYGFFFYVFCVPSAMISVILPFIHMYPPGSSAKPILAGLLLVKLCILHVALCNVLQNFAEEMIPKLILHYEVQMVMAVVSIICSSLTTSLANTAHSTCRLPNVIRKILGVILGRLCCFGEQDVKGDFAQLGMNIPYDRQNDMAPIVTDSAQPDEHQGHPAEGSLDRLNAELSTYRRKQQIDREWYQLAIILDRIAFIVFLLFIIIYSAGMRDKMIKTPV